MKFRSCILLVCMATVPAVAMFSHKIPRDWRLAGQRLARGEGLARGESPVRAKRIDRDEQSSRTAAPVAEVPTMRPLKPQPRLAAASPPRSPGANDNLSLVRTEVEEQLAVLGAIALECTPTKTGGLHRCSCRVPADRSGKLQRVFQASHADEVVALRNLLGQVQFWKHRLAVRPMPGERPPTPADAAPPGRHEPRAAY